MQKPIEVWPLNLSSQILRFIVAALPLVLLSTELPSFVRLLVCPPFLRRMIRTI